ncbi:MAG TPA: hypothetical protein VEG30_18930 [Terriglobales bacterium]|nr:hypothetical protein [Terriglobales bacterium]
MTKSAVLAVMLVGIGVLAQEAPPPAQQPEPQIARTNLVERAAGPSYSDIYCAGFITKQNISHVNSLIGGLGTPHAIHFTQDEYVFLSASGLQEGTRYAIVRELRDPNEYEMFHGQKAAINAVGQPYAELGYVRVLQIRGAIAVARVEFSCQSLTAGDLVVPYQEKPPLFFHDKHSLEMFPTNTSTLSGRIVLSKDFDSEAGTGDKVYVNVGAEQGVKPGDYFRVMRSYDPDKMDYVDALSYNNPAGEDTQKNYPKITKAELKMIPNRAIGEGIVLNVTPASSTIMITFSRDAVQVGDAVEMEGVPK